MKKVLNFLQQKNVVLGVYILVAIVASVHLIYLGNKSFNGLDIYKHYNNFVIFRFSFIHLIHYQDLYILHPLDQYDLFKYSPTFALLMFPFAYMPEGVGLVVWNVFNALILYVAVRKIPLLTQKISIFVLWFILQETLTGLQSAQTNPLIAALLILAYTSFENKKVIWASLFIVLTVYIKIFGVVAFLMFFLYPDKLKFILYTILWTVLLAFLPLMVVSFDQLLFLYKSWINMLQNDHSVSYGLSVMGWLKTWFGLEPDKFLVVAIGGLLLMMPLIQLKSYSNSLFRILYLSSILIWVIIFNHKAESSTFVIAVCGIAIWFFSQQNSKFQTVLVLFAFLFTCLSPTDLFPRILRTSLVEPYVLKAVPCIFIWMMIQYQLIKGNYQLRREAN